MNVEGVSAVILSSFYLVISCVDCTGIYKDYTLTLTDEIEKESLTVPAAAFGSSTSLSNVNDQCEHVDDSPRGYKRA